jgi:hypothetical protein
MSRARNIKPGFFKNEELVELLPETRLLFIGLWTLADREGRMEDRPKRVKMEIFPADQFNVDSMLNDLQAAGFLTRYEVDGCKYIQVTNFVKHQDPHYRERASTIPPPAGVANEIVATNVTRTQRARIIERDGGKCRHCGGVEQLCIDHVVPVSRGGTSDDGNLQVLCLSCNTKKGNKLSEVRVNVESTHAPDALLIPDSLIPDSLIPSEAIASGASAPGEPEQVKGVPAAAAADPIWHTGLAFLTRKGIPSEQARKFLGKLKREAGDIDAAALLADAEAQDITDPVPWLSAGAVTARERAKQRGSPSAPPMGKQMQGLMVLEAMKSGNRMAAGRGTERAAEDVLLVAGPDTRG